MSSLKMAAPARAGLLRQLFGKQISVFPLGKFTNSPTDIKLRCIHSVFCKATFSTEATEKEVKPAKDTISKAMRLYLQRSREHEEFMKKESINYKIGKRHLANMMGEDPEIFSQEDIDRAIEYLFPSGVFEPRARPLMKPPEEVFPQKKEAEFDESGRPHHFLFYTGKPNYYKLLHDIVTHMNDLNKYEDGMIRNHKYPGEADVLDFSGSEWISKNNLELLLVETINEREYDNFVKVMERLSNHPYAFRLKDFIFKHRKLLISQTKTSEIPKPILGDDGKSRITVIEAQRKTARAKATIIYPGTGKITINGADILYFDMIQSREQILFPLTFTGLVDQVDVEATVTKGGKTSQAGAIRWAIAWGLRSFVSTDTLEKMRLAGLLTKDLRRKERKKPGQAGARKKFTWKKR